MKMFWTEDQKVGVELHKVDVTRLEHARAIGAMLVQLRQPEGEALIEAADAILSEFPRVTKAKQGEGDDNDADH